MTARIVRPRNWSVLAVAVPAAMVAVWSAPAASARPVGAQSARPGWRIVKMIKSGGISLHDITALPKGKAWASASAGTTTLVPLFYHRTGGRWVKEPRPGIPSHNVFAADISASNDANVWGALANGSAVDHWNGHVWTRTSFSSTFGVAVDGVLAFGSNQAKVFTFNFTSMKAAVHSFSGTHWSSKVLPAQVDGDSNVNLVSASSSSNIWALSLTTHTNRWQTLHFNGKTWSVVKVPAALIPSTSDGPAQILALSPSNVWATITTNSSSNTMILLHWNGTAWRKAAGTPPSGELLGPIASDGHGGLWLYAAHVLTTPPFLKPFFVHYANGKFTTATAPTTTLGPLFINALALIPGTRSLLAVGDVTSGESVLAGVIEQYQP